MEELKIYIDSAEEIRHIIKEIGAKYSKSLDVRDTYYNQPGMVLKITETDGKSFLTQLKAKNGGFEFVKKEELQNADKKKKEFEQKFGVLCILEKTREFWDYKDYNINLNLFNDIGNFLIVEGKSVNPDFFTTILGIENPRYLTKSFAQLKLDTI
ncbi:CYTH domain-containing protein [Candidatus Dojkabacteria bacterium]|nr:CYTH domain-containing protein [Candidatus Dojkabacteria bacterium]